MGLLNKSITKTVTNLDEIQNYHDYIDSIRSSLDYDIDGIVYKLNNLKLQSRLEILQILQDGQ